MEVLWIFFNHQSAVTCLLFMLIAHRAYQWTYDCIFKNSMRFRFECKNFHLLTGLYWRLQVYKPILPGQFDTNSFLILTSRLQAVKRSLLGNSYSSFLCMHTAKWIWMQRVQISPNLSTVLSPGSLIRMLSLTVNNFKHKGFQHSEKSK